MLVFYLKNRKEDLFIEKMLSDIFEYDQVQVKELLNEGDCLIRYENRVLDNISEFRVELVVYIQNESQLNDRKLNNNFFLGLKIANYINEGVIISYAGHDPYLWLLIKENHFFLVEEIAQDSNGISLMENNRIEISNIDFGLTI